MEEIWINFKSTSKKWFKYLWQHLKNCHWSKWLLHNWLFQKKYKLIAIHLSKKQKLDADPKTIQQINFTRNLDQNGHT